MKVIFVAYLRLFISLICIGLLGRLSNSESAILDNSTNSKTLLR